jgi:hypothetical protein
MIYLKHENANEVKELAPQSPEDMQSSPVHFSTELQPLANKSWGGIRKPLIPSFEALQTRHD